MNARFAPLETTQLEQAAQPKRWVWDGLLGPGQITLFTSVWKSGKTTLLAHLLAQRKTGGMLAGRAVAQGVSAIVTEEPPSLWQERSAPTRTAIFCRKSWPSGRPIRCGSWRGNRARRARTYSQHSGRRWGSGRAAHSSNQGAA